jgi:hypothetical protein
MNIIIIPGSYKPPHKGHLSLIEKLIKNKNKKLKIIIIISKKSRPLDNHFSYDINKYSKEEIQNAFMKYFPNNKIISLSKNNLIKKINKLIEENKLDSINADQSLKIWNIYLKYLKKKYKDNPYFPEIIFKISETNNIIKETINIVLKSFREKPLSITLMKSKKNANNTRFKFLEEKYSKYIKVKLFPNIKDIDATGMRLSILNNNRKLFDEYLPKDLEQNKKDKIWKILSYIK